MKKQVSFFCAVVSFLTATAFGQVLKVEPEKPKWGDKLKITYDPNAPDAPFMLGQQLNLRIEQTGTDAAYGMAVKSQIVPMIKGDKVLTCEVTVNEDVSGVQVTLVYRGKLDPKSTQVLMAYRSDGQPVKGAYLLQARRSRNYQELIDKELALYPENYSAYMLKWWRAKALKVPNLNAIIEADIKSVSTRVKGMPSDWLYSLVYGHLFSGQEEKSREFLRMMMEQYPDSPRTEDVIFRYRYESRAQHFTKKGQQEFNQMSISFMKRYPEHSRILAEYFAYDKEMPLEAVEPVLRKWIAAEPQTLDPYIALAHALNEREQRPDQIASLSEKALELMLQGKDRENGSPEVRVEPVDLPRVYYLNAQSAFKLGRYVQALSAIKAAQALNKETPAEYLLLEGRIWEKAGVLARAEQAYLTAWQRGSKEAAAALKPLYLQDGGAPNGFENWLSKRSAETTTNTAGNSSKKSFADFSVTTVVGKKYDLAALRGKVVVLNFWFIGCGPCHAEMPELNKLVEAYEGKDVVFLAAALDDSESIKTFLKEKAFNYEIIPDARAWTEKLGVRGYPTHYILNQQGEVELLLVGGNDKNLEQIRNVLARLTAVK